MASKPLAPNGLPIVGVLTTAGTVAAIDPASTGGPAVDLIIELQEHPIASPLVAVDSDGCHWDTSKFPIN